MILADMIGRRRPDYRILTRALLTGLDESAAGYMIPVPFPHEPDAQAKMLEMRAEAMAHLEKNGLIALFPSGSVAASETMFGPAIEGEWNVFTAKMIRTSGRPPIVPFCFTGSNSRWYQIANRISPVLRQGLLIHEVVHSFDKPQAPIIGHPITPDEWEGRIGKPREFMAVAARAHAVAQATIPERVARFSGSAPAPLRDNRRSRGRSFGRAIPPRHIW